ncbi:DinB family protein [Mucilaginibacter pedocola]|uniref:DNA damage-inducible protein DinB n=1 Tax=Mucilaginibacter pedocola TaxID=1792845 RepID=A0A1S9PN63_9SPHI|nr:DinB family protein [Mucilaginibacter pedocola]OOQ62018.1 DNA damage-inducible protein DinB [Mucilaginibacter pedocola]
MRIIPAPQPGEYPANTAEYLKLIPTDGTVLKCLQNNIFRIKDLVYSLPEEKLLFRYAPGKWSIKETLVHIMDDERIYAYRALCFARKEKQGLPGFDQNVYAKYSGADKRTLDSIFEEYEAVRKATITLFNGLPDDALERKGIGTGSFDGGSVRALAYHIAGHEMHHYFVIKNKYLVM